MESNVATQSKIQRMKQEIETLRQQQSEALKSATYLGVSRQEADEQERRRGKITKLVNQIEQLSRSRGRLSVPWRDR